GERRDRCRIETRPGFRHIEAAVAGEPREGHVDKTERRSLAAGGYITHVRPSGLTPTHTTQQPLPRPFTDGHGPDQAIDFSCVPVPNRPVTGNGNGGILEAAGTPHKDGERLPGRLVNRRRSTRIAC